MDHPLNTAKYTLGIINPGDMLTGVQGGSSKVFFLT
jgi:hypothetical protein